MLGYIKYKQEFLNESIEDIVDKLIDIYPESETAQIKSWKNLIDDLKQSEKFSLLPPETVIAIEYSLPNDDMKIDLIIAFNERKNRHIYIIESKQWNDQYIYKAEYSGEREFGKELHPQVQCDKYVLSFKEYLDIGRKCDIFPIVFIKNCSVSGLQHLIQQNPNGKSLVPCFNKMDSIVDFIMSQEHSDINLLEELKNATYKPSKSVIDSMQSLITHEAPFILTSEQHKALSIIRSAIKSGKKVIRITGVAGSGKTAILLHIFVSYLKNIDKLSVIPCFVSGAQNTSLYRSLYPKVGNLFQYSYTVAKNIPKTKGEKYIVLMDETQHNKEGIITQIIEKNATLIVCYDEKQAINANNSLNELRNLETRDDFISIKLTDTIRFNGSKVAELNIKNLIKGKTDFLEDDKFEFKLFDNINDFKNKILDTININPDSTVAVAGLLSDDSNKYTVEQNPDSIFFTHWKKEEECNWIPYIKEKNYLIKNNGKIWVGTWWLPGLDVDYIAVIVGGDAKLTSEGIVAIPEQAKHYEMMISIAEKLSFLENVKETKNSFGKICIDNRKTVSNILVFLRQPKNERLYRKFIDDFSKYLSNNYYITLTRGRKGCFVYFTNNELGE